MEPTERMATVLLAVQQLVKDTKAEMQHSACRRVCTRRVKPRTSQVMPPPLRTTASKPPAIMDIKMRSPIDETPAASACSHPAKSTSFGTAYHTCQQNTEQQYKQHVDTHQRSQQHNSIGQHAPQMQSGSSRLHGNA